MPTATARTKSYQDFSSNLHDRMQAERVAASATIEISRRCPLKCVHCYNNLPDGGHGRQTRRAYLLRALSHPG